MDLKLKNDIQQYIKDYPIEINWDGNTIGNTTIDEILEKGEERYIEELYDLNMDFLLELEDNFLEQLYNEFETELRKEFLYKDEAIEYIRESNDIPLSLNEEELFDSLPDITVCIKFYNNYDCTNSFDTFETSEYLCRVYDTVKGVVKKEEFLEEHRNGAYGGSLFVFVFKTSINNYLRLKENFREKITIPKNTQFGFHSSFSGSSSLFRHYSTNDITLDRFYGDSKYDEIGLVADREQNYSIADVYGNETGFIEQGNIFVI